MRDIQQQLDTELNDAPASTFQVVDTVIAGRSALRRRRLALGGAALTIALVSGGVAYSLTGTSPAQTEDRTAAEQPTPDPLPEPGLGPWNTDEPLQKDAAGEIHVHPDAVVAKRLAATYPTGMTVELFHVTFETADDVWAAIPQSGANVWTKRLPAGQTLKEWAQLQFATDHPDDSWVRFGADGRLIGLQDLRILDQITDPGLGENFAGTGTPTAVAEVKKDGLGFFLAVRAMDGNTEAIPSPRTTQIATLDDFLEHARAQYATNDEGGSEGLR